MLWKKSSIRGNDLTTFIDEGSEIEGKYTFSGTVLLNGRFRREIISNDTLIDGGGISTCCGSPLTLEDTFVEGNTPNNIRHRPIDDRSGREAGRRRRGVGLSRRDLCRRAYFARIRGWRPTIPATSVSVSGGSPPTGVGGLITWSVATPGALAVEKQRTQGIAGVVKPRRRWRAPTAIG